MVISWYLQNVLWLPAMKAPKIPEREVNVPRNWKKGRDWVPSIRTEQSLAGRKKQVEMRRGGSQVQRHAHTPPLLLLKAVRRGTLRMASLGQLRPRAPFSSHTWVYIFHALGILANNGKGGSSAGLVALGRWYLASGHSNSTSPS